MKKLLSLLFLTLFSTAIASPLDLDCKEGKQRLMNSTYSDDYWILNSHYISQKPHCCGLGSATMVLNALDIIRPNIEEYAGYPLFTPGHVLNVIENIINQEAIKAGKMNLQVLADCFRKFSLHAELIYADSINICELRTLLKDHLNDPHSFLIANYYRPSLGQDGKGNFSPVGAYDEESDTVLLLDPLREQHGPFWVSIKELYRGMCQRDASGQARGILVVEKNYIEIFSEKGKKMLKNSEFNKTYFKLSRYFETQEHWTYCVIASSVAAMNCLQDQVIFSQESFFTPEIEKIVTAKEVKTNWRGVTAAEAVKMVDLCGFNAEFTSADSTYPYEFRETLKAVLNDPTKILIANYYRPEAGQVGGGHWSPIVAYCQENDAVLVLDTSRYKYPPVWIDLNQFFSAMDTKDNEVSRGYLIISKKDWNLN